MQWVVAENCTIPCDVLTVCKRPLEFIEPLMCMFIALNFYTGIPKQKRHTHDLGIHRDWNLPDDLLKAPTLTATYDTLLLWIIVAILTCIVFLQIWLIYVTKKLNSDSVSLGFPSHRDERWASLRRWKRRILEAPTTHIGAFTSNILERTTDV